VAGEYDSVFDCDCGYDGKSVFLPDHRLVGDLEKIVRLPSFLGTASCEGVMLNVENGMVGNASYSRALQWEFEWMSIACDAKAFNALDLRGGEGEPREDHLRFLS